MQFDNRITLMTFNIYGNRCNIKRATDYINHSNIDIICTQEDLHREQEIPSNYNLVAHCGLGGTQECVYINKTDIMKHNIKCDDIKCIDKITDISVVDDSGITKLKKYVRSAVIFTYRGIKIANLHLLGGRFIDEILFKVDESSTCGNDIYLTTLIKNKLSLLEEIARQQPDIILGDFNSVYHSNEISLQKMLDKQYEHFESILNKKLTDNERFKINAWNIQVYSFLGRKYKYTYAKPSNEHDTITNGRGKTIVDTIWYRDDPTKFKVINTYIDPIMNNDDTYNDNCCTYSDHNPVITTIELNYLVQPSSDAEIPTDETMSKILALIHGTTLTNFYKIISSKKILARKGDPHIHSEPCGGFIRLNKGAYLETIFTDQKDFMFEREIYFIFSKDILNDICDYHINNRHVGGIKVAPMNPMIRIHNFSSYKNFNEYVKEKYVGRNEVVFENDIDLKYLKEIWIFKNLKQSLKSIETEPGVIKREMQDIPKEDIIKIEREVKKFLELNGINIPVKMIEEIPKIDGGYNRMSSQKLVMFNKTKISYSKTNERSSLVPFNHCY
jgi:exonuclease III